MTWMPHSLAWYSILLAILANGQALEALVEMIAVVDFLADAGQVANGERFDYAISRTKVE